VSTPPAPSQANEDVYEDRLRAIYDEAGRAAAVFLEWRHKVILLCSATIALTFAAVSWSFKEGLSRGLVIAPLLLAAAVMVLCVRFDRRNGFLINTASYGVAQECERALRCPGGRVEDLPVGVWTTINTVRGDKLRYKPPRRTYSRMLRRTYQGLAVGLVGAALAVGIFGVPERAESRSGRITLTSGVVLCGTLVSDGSGDVAVALKGTGEVRLVSVRELRRIKWRAC
jgi:hypothetical protein